MDEGGSLNMNYVRLSRATCPANGPATFLIIYLEEFFFFFFENSHFSYIDWSFLYSDAVFSIIMQMRDWFCELATDLIYTISISYLFHLALASTSSRAR